jgi:hypothetical protein
MNWAWLLLKFCQRLILHAMMRKAFDNEGKNYPGDNQGFFRRPLL